MARTELLLIGPTGNTHVASSLHRAALADGIGVEVLDSSAAFNSPRLVRAITWRLGGRRPPRLQTFSDHAVAAALACRPRWVACIGQAPVTAAALDRVRNCGALVLNYSTDDPWNPAYRATWFMEALRRYTTVFTPRADTLDDFRQLGCRDVRVLPFAFDTQLIPPMPEHRQPPDCDILFVGGADRDRVPIMQAVAESGLKLKLFGGYWDRHPVLKRYWAGNCDIRTIVAETWRAPVNICLVRRANRDGHVMRTFEIAAAGGFIVAEDTADHRRIFGGDGECVLYFRTVPELIAKAVWALEHPAERERMAVDARRRITAGGNTYLDRLRTMLSASGGPVQTRASAGSGGGVPCPEPLF